MTITSGGYPKRKAKSTIKFCTNLCVFFLLAISLLGMMVGIIVLGTSEKPDPDSLTKLVTCNVKEIAPRTCTTSCTLTVYVPVLGKSVVTEPFSSSDKAFSYTSGQSIDCYVNLYYENYENQKVSVNEVQTNFSYVTSVVGGVMIGFSFLLLVITCGLSYYSCAMLIRP
ncbi:hypothetical protein C9374_010944 [Naegleria lovaniensis]|uniref:Uncharacterized protein n=1 Tax=Naegleria lovaniensis TaxID=51637 RepID=A0AA88KFA5_NAELO|nr:uncharacterized protein C9374_010944 [Naegleria lovaniensis]KAG2374374.1 hypothetical protein C9374_010944 [Naegleria lovaniensis]